MHVLKQLTINDEKLEAFPFKRELSMQAYLIENPDILNIDEDFYTDVQIYDEEIVVKNGGRGSEGDGRIDLVASYAGEYIAIIELKKGPLDEKALKQLEAYLAERKRLLQSHDHIVEHDDNQENKWIGVLVGDSIDIKMQEKFLAGYAYENIPIAAMTIKRFRGSRGHVYVISDTYFKNQLSGKDLTKYEFNGKLYGKGKLVLAVMQAYVSENLEVTYSQLRKEFPDFLTGKSKRPLFVSEHDANEILGRTGYKRHFIKPNEIIFINGEHIAISSQWSIGNIEGFVEHAKSLGYKINAKITKKNNVI